MKYEHRIDVPDEHFEDPSPDTQKDPQRFLDPPPWMDADSDDAGPDTLPSGEDPAVYATDVVMIAGCETDPETIAVAANHEHESLCEYFAPVAAYDDGNGNFDEVAAQFMWASTDPYVVGLSYPLGPNNNLAYPHGKRDVFDAGGNEEPTSIIVACAVNDCPDDALPYECPLMVCATMTVLSVVNLEGTWELSGPAIPPDTLMNPAQDGRSFEDDAIGAWKGSVHGSTMRFDIGDYRFEGEIAPDRDHLSGQVIELMGYSDIGTWSATRISS